MRSARRDPRRDVAPDAHLARPGAACRAGRSPISSGEMLSTSDDNTAELLLKEIGARQGGAVVLAAAGLAVVRGHWRVGRPARRRHADRRIGARPRQPGDVRAALGRARPRRAGRPGRRRAAGGRSDGHPGRRLPRQPGRGATPRQDGHANQHEALSGFVDGTDGKRHVSFSYVQNGSGADLASLPVWDALGRTLTTYPQAPPVQQLAPTPAAPPG